MSISDMSIWTLRRTTILLRRTCVQIRTSLLSANSPVAPLRCNLLKSSNKTARHISCHSERSEESFCLISGINAIVIGLLFALFLYVPNFRVVPVRDGACSPTKLIQIANENHSHQPYMVADASDFQSNLSELVLWGESFRWIPPKNPFPDRHRGAIAWRCQANGFLFQLR